MTLKELRQSQGISAKDMVAVIQQVHPRYDKTLQSKVESGEYGITLSPEAMERVEQEFPEIKTSKRSGDRHRLKCRLSTRLPDAEYHALCAAAQADGYATLQECIMTLIHRYLDGRGGETDA